LNAAILRPAYPLDWFKNNPNRNWRVEPKRLGSCNGSVDRTIVHDKKLYLGTRCRRCGLKDRVHHVWENIGTVSNAEDN
jgi:hypothetical protein